MSQNHGYYFAMKMMDTEFNWSTRASLSTSTLSSGNYEVLECPVPGLGGGGGDGMIASKESAAHSAGMAVRAEWALGTAQPNPTPGRTMIKYSVRAHGPVRIALYDVAGRLVRTLVNETVDVGPHTIEWDGRSDAGDRVRSGVYYYRMVADTWKSNRQLVVFNR